MTAKEIHDRLWIIQYTAMVNQLYYERLGAFARTVDWLVRLVTVGTAVVGGVCGIVGSIKPTLALDASNVAIGTAGIGIAIVFDMLAVGKLVRYCEGLRERWTDLRSGSEKLELSLEPASDEAASEGSVAAVGQLLESKNGIDRDERLISIDRLHRACQRQINRQTYAVSEGTFAEVMKKKGLAA
jgi:hypothetical protein